MQNVTSLGGYRTRKTVLSGNYGAIALIAIKYYLIYSVIAIKAYVYGVVAIVVARQMIMVSMCLPVHGNALH